jgi:DNA repair exonuclease SbcCD ATPase subunit
MSENHDRNIAEIRNAYAIIDDNFWSLIEVASDDSERRMLQSSRDAARDTFWAAAAKSLEDNHALVQQVRSDLSQANTELEEMIAQMESISKIIDLIAKVVKLASSLATLAAA